jgi:hypothetical protein
LQEVITDLYHTVRHVQLSDLKHRVEQLLNAARTKLGITRLSIIVDEAHILSSELAGAFSNSPDAKNPEGEARPLLSALVRILTAPEIQRFVNIILAGTALSLLDRDIISPAVSRHGNPKPQTFTDFGVFTVEDAKQYVETFVGSEEAAEAAAEIKKALGRRRFVSGPVQRWLTEEGAKPVKEYFKQEFLMHTHHSGFHFCNEGRAQYEKYYLYGRLAHHRRTHGEVFELLKRVAFAQHVLDLPARFVSR